MTVSRERSKGGCWTCKLRKKKCDETQPSCKTCTSLDITCHGYGSRPGWMNGGVAEKDTIEVLRKKVKETTSLKRKSRNSHGKAHHRRHADDKADNNVIQPSHSSRVSASLANEPTIDVSQSSARVIDWPPDQSRSPNGFVHEQDSGPDDFTLSNWKPPLGEDETGLLMHYLDYVFPLQFPFYKHSPASGGRGWLLSLLLKAEPLYHAALSVASYHQHYELYCEVFENRYGTSAMLNDLPPCSRLNAQLRRHTLAIERLQQYLEKLRSKTGMTLNEQIELLSCMVLLISLEVCLSFKRSPMQREIIY